MKLLETTIALIGFCIVWVIYFIIILIEAIFTKIFKYTKKTLEFLLKFFIPKAINQFNNSKK